VNHIQLRTIINYGPSLMIILKNIYEKRMDKHYSRHVLENKNAFVPLYVSFARKENRHSRMVVNWILKFYNENTLDWQFYE